MCFQIAHSGIDLQVTRGPGDVQTILITRKDGAQTITETITTNIVKTTAYHSSAKRPRIESSFRREFDEQVAALNEWFDKTEVNLELLTTDATDPKEQLTLEEQVVLVEV